MLPDARAGRASGRRLCVHAIVPSLSIDRAPTPCPVTGAPDCKLTGDASPFLATHTCRDLQNADYALRWAHRDAGTNAGTHAWVSRGGGCARWWGWLGSTPAALLSAWELPFHLHDLHRNPPPAIAIMLPSPSHFASFSSLLSVSSHHTPFHANIYSLRLLLQAVRRVPSG